MPKIRKGKEPEGSMSKALRETEETRAMAFEDTGIVELGEGAGGLPGVRAVWVHRFSNQHAGIWVLIGDAGDRGWLDRRRVHAKIKSYLSMHGQSANEPGLIFERYVFTEDEESSQPPIPRGAFKIAPTGNSGGGSVLSVPRFEP
jgi:hypothetical protein